MGTSQASARRSKKPETRTNVKALADRPSAQVLIIGGGINGIATFRDLALQGVDVALVERNDYGSGASSSSSHMIHGGIRYLENGEFRLVKESVQERNRLLKLAPHYVRPLQTTIPIFSTFSGIFAAPLRLITHKQRTPKERGALLIKAGLLIYDSFSRGGGRVPRHEFHGRAASLAKLPSLNHDLKYTATYYDASVHNPERLTLDVLMDGDARGEHARPANYVEAVGAGSDGVLLRDRVSGVEFAFSAEVVINASGPWTDLTGAELGSPSRFMGETRGSHIVLDNPELLAACDGRELFFENDDGRIVLIYPLNGRVLVGTTDLEADVSERAVCTDEEIDYFFHLIAHVFPQIAVGRSQIVYTYSGVRPLPRHEDTQPGFVSRDYRIERGRLPGTPETTLLSLVGGKLTTFRALAERLSDMTLEILHAPRVTSTKDRSIGGGVGYPTSPAGIQRWIGSRTHDGFDRQRVEELFARYGTRADAVIQYLREHGDVPLAHYPSLSEAELRFMAEHESVVHLWDVVLRRTNMAFRGEVSVAVIEEIGQVLGDALQWSEAMRAKEVANTVSELTDYHGVRLHDTTVMSTARA